MTYDGRASGPFVVEAQASRSPQMEIAFGRTALAVVTQSRRAAPLSMLVVTQHTHPGMARNDMHRPSQGPRPALASQQRCLSLSSGASALFFGSLQLLSPHREECAPDRSALFATIIIAHNTHSPMRATTARTLAVKFCGILHTRPLRSLRLLSSLGRRTSLSSFPSIDDRREAAPVRRLTSSSISVHIPDLSHGYRFSSTERLESFVVARSGQNRHPEVKRNTYLVVVVFLQFISSTPSLATVRTSSRTWCTIVVLWSISMPAVYSARVKLAVFLICIDLWSSPSLLSHSQLQLTYAEMPHILVPPVSMMPSPSRARGIPTVFSDVLFLLPWEKRETHVPAAGLCDSAPEISRISNFCKMGDDRDFAQILEKADTEQCRDIRLFCSTECDMHEDPQAEGIRGLYEDTLCAFGAFEGDGWIAGSHAADDYCTSDVEWVDIPVEEDEVMMEREVAVDSTGCSRWDFADAAMSCEIAADDPESFGFNEWEDADGEALDVMLRKLDRIVVQRRDGTNVHAGRDEVAHCSDGQIRTERRTSCDDEKKHGSDVGTRGGGRRWSYSGMRQGLRALKRKIQGRS